MSASRPRMIKTTSFRARPCQICVRVIIVEFLILFFTVCTFTLKFNQKEFSFHQQPWYVFVCACGCITDGCKTCQLCIVSSRRLKTRMTHQTGARAQTGPYMASLGCFLLLQVLVLVSTACFKRKIDSCNFPCLHICS